MVICDLLLTTLEKCSNKVITNICNGLKLNDQSKIQLVQIPVKVSADNSIENKAFSVSLKNQKMYQKLLFEIIVSKTKQTCSFGS